MAKLIDEVVQRILREAEERAYRLLQDHRADLDKLAEALLEREELDRDDVAKLLGPRPGNPDSASLWGIGVPVRLISAARPHRT